MVTAASPPVRRRHRAATPPAASTGPLLGGYTPLGGVWLQLRECESSDNYATNTGNGFYGAYQFTLQTWAGLGLAGLPEPGVPADPGRRRRAPPGRSRLGAMAGLLGRPGAALAGPASPQIAQVSVHRGGQTHRGLGQGRVGLDGPHRPVIEKADRRSAAGSGSAGHSCGRPPHPGRALWWKRRGA